MSVRAGGGARGGLGHGQSCEMKGGKGGGEGEVARRSFKGLKRVATVGPLHKGTKAAERAEVRAEAAKEARGQPLGQGRRKIWAGVASDARGGGTPAAAASGRTTTTGAGATEEVSEKVLGAELARCRALGVLRKFFEKLVREDAHGGSPAQGAEGGGPTGVPPVMAFERFHLSAMRECEEGGHGASGGRAGEGVPRDPLLPQCPPRWTEPGLVADLVRARHTEASARRIAEAVANKCASLASDVAGGWGFGEVRVEIKRHKHTCDVVNSAALGPKDPGALLKLNHEHLAKLWSMWHAARGVAVPELPAEEEDAGAEGLPLPQAWCDAVWRMLLRYHALGGHGYQAACGQAVFEVFSARLGVEHEAFASPLNAWFPVHYSAFPDTDGAFGSRGSFYLAGGLSPSAGEIQSKKRAREAKVSKAKFKSLAGSFQVNPPFIPRHILDVAILLDAHLASVDDDVPLSFCVVVPGWEEDPGCQRLAASPFLDRHWVLARRDCGFCDGAQHQRRDRFRDSPFDTSVLILRNAAARRKWPERDDDEVAVRRAFALSLPSDAARDRRKASGRGLADADGGGGVYRGKPSRRQRTPPTAAAADSKAGAGIRKIPPAGGRKKKKRRRHAREGTPAAPPPNAVPA